MNKFCKISKPEKLKKTKTIITLLLALLIFSAPAFALESGEAPGSEPPKSESPGCKVPKCEPPKQVEKGDFEQKCAEKREKWESLTDKQKKQIFEIQEKIDKLSSQMADKYCELGVLTAEEAARIKEFITERADNMRVKGYIPGIHCEKRGDIKK